MTRLADRERAIKLREEGNTYGDIKKALNVAKSSLSDWLSNYPLTPKQISALERNKKNKKFLAIEKTIITKQIKRQKRLSDVYEEQREKWIKLNKNKDELELAGLFFYWGEGNKRLDGPVSISNTDPEALKFILQWFTKGLEVPQDKIKVNLQLYSDMNENEAIQFWSKELNLPLSQFSKPYIKQSKRVNITHKGFGHGTCGLAVNDVRLKEKVMMMLKVIADSYTVVTSKSFL